MATASATNIESSKSLSETKKLRREAEASKLKKKGNLKQFLFNAEILDEVKSITKDLHTQDTASANKAAKRTIRLIERRQKLIKLADKSEAGWLAVDEYESDELADDSADEKRIRKAQDKAVRIRSFRWPNLLLGLALLVVAYGMFRPTLRITCFFEVCKNPS